MKENRGLSSSEQYVKKSNRRLLFVGLILLIVFLVALAFISEKRTTQREQSALDYRNELANVTTPTNTDIDLFARGDAQLKVDPTQIDMNNVVIGSKVEAIISLTAENTPIIFLGMDFAESQQDGFTLETTCTPNGTIEVNKTCIVKVLWNPVSLRQIQNILTIRWKEDSETSFREQKTTIQVKAQSTDSKDCVICENVTQAEKEIKTAMGLDGKLYEVNEDGTITINGKKIKVTENGLYIDEDGNIVGIAVPDKIALNMKSEIMGTISPTRDIISPSGEKIGRLLGDDTIVDTNLNVLGAAIPIVSVMDMDGKVIGKMLPDGTVVDGKNTVIGKPLVDSSVVDLDGKPLGILRPWGLVVDFTGKVMGGIIPDGTVLNGKNDVVAIITPNGLALNTAGDLVGGTIPQGVAVGTGCQAVGKVLLNGTVQDSFEQTVGTALIDGTVINTDGQEIGTIIPQGLVINEKGQIIGFVNSEGKAVGAKGSVIGCINPDGSISAGKKLVGAVMEKGRVIGYGCQQIGSVYPNGTVINEAGQTVGQVMADKYVKNTENKVIGIVIPRASAIADGCRLLGLISINGRVMDMGNKPIGCMTPDKTIINEQGETIGSIATKGIVFDDKGSPIGRIRLDGKVMDKTGKVIGCVNPDGSVTTLDGKTLGTLSGKHTGVILDENGNPTGWTTLGNKVFDMGGSELGSVNSDGIVTSISGKIIGTIPSNGVIFSPDGLILGRYSTKIGYGINQGGERFARILPDLTAISGEAGDVIGALIPDNTAFMDLNNTYLGTMQLDGTLKNATGNIIGAIRADGSVADKEGKIIGIQIPTGRVYSPLGKEVGSVSNRGEVLSGGKTRIGTITATGIALSTDGKVLGGILPRLSLAMDPNGLLGYPTAQGLVLDKNGNQAGKATPFGLVINDGKVIGRLLRIGVYMDNQNKTVGWTSFDGVLNGKDGRPTGKIFANGIAFDKTNKFIGSLVKKGLVLDQNGKFISTVSVDNKVIQNMDKVLGTLSGSALVYNSADEAIGRFLKPGIAVNNDGLFMGWTRSDGTIGNQRESLGSIWFDNRVVNNKGAIIGSYIPLDSVAFNDASQTIGLISATGEITTPQGQVRGRVIDPQTVMIDGTVVGRLLDEYSFVSENTAGKLAAQTSTDGVTFQVTDGKAAGFVMLNGLAFNLTKQVMGALTPLGVPVTNALTLLGREFLTGDVILKGKQEAKASGTTALYNDKEVLMGMVLPSATFIGKNGVIIGKSAASVDITNRDGKKIAVQMAMGTALSPDNLWAGGKLPSGVAVNDDAQEIGTVAADGAIIGKGNLVVGRILSDGVAVDIPDRELFNVMPYGGNLVAQGLPLGYRGNILGRTTINGDVLDATDNKTFRILDDGTILGKDEPLVGAVLPFYPAIAHDGSVLGTLSGNGTIVAPSGETRGKIAVNGTVKISEYEILGALIPDRLVTNDCKVIGQTSLNGQVIDAKGTVVGHILPDKWAVNAQGQHIGRVTRKGSVISTTGDYLGRTMPDSTVVDTSGVNMGCARNDGSVVDNAGNVIGSVIERGLVLGKDGKPMGRVKADGTVVNTNGDVIGKVLADGSVIDLEGNVIGHMVSRDQEILYDNQGNIKGTFGTDGTFYDPKTGQAVFRVDPDGKIYDSNGNMIGQLENGEFVDAKGNKLDELTILRDKDGNAMGIISGCDVINSYGEKIGSILADGSVVDLNGETFATVLGNGMILDKSGNEMGTVSGTNPRLDKCGIKTTDSADIPGIGAAAGRGIFIGNKIYGITDKGSIVNDEGIVIGYMGEDGKPYTLDNRALTGTGDSQGRSRPDLNKKPTVSAEQLQQMQQILAQKRENMKLGIKDNKKVITPNKRIQAMSRNKKDANWASLGIKKNVSSYPVDMSRMILRDKAIPAVITRSIDSRYSTVPVTAIVERHIYSETGRNILIPAGSRIIGSFTGSQATDKRVAKLEITWARLIRPDGGTFRFEATSGDAQGRGGVAAYLDEQLVNKYGKPIMTSVVTSAVSYMMAVNEDIDKNADTGTTTTSSKAEAANDARENFINAMDQIFNQLIQESANVPPVIFVPSGTRVTIFSNEDLWLRAEEDDVEDVENEMGADSPMAKKPGVSSWVDQRRNQSGEASNNGSATTENIPGTPDIVEEDYYTPIDSSVSDNNSSSEADSQASDTPLYDGQKKKETLETRKVEPVLPQTGTSNRLF